MIEAVKQQLRSRGRLYVRKNKKKKKEECPKATQSAMSPRNTFTVSPTSSPSIYQCPENSDASESAAIWRSRDHGKHSNSSPLHAEDRAPAAVFVHHHLHLAPATGRVTVL